MWGELLVRHVKETRELELQLKEFAEALVCLHNATPSAVAAARGTAVARAPGNSHLGNRPGLQCVNRWWLYRRRIYEHCGRSQYNLCRKCPERCRSGWRALSSTRRCS